MRSAGSVPMAKRMKATCDPVNRADASFAAKAIAPNRIAEHIISSSARRVAVASCGGFGIVKARRLSMTDLAVREARREDAPVIIGFQLAMAKETEELDLDVDIL